MRPFAAGARTRELPLRHGSSLVQPTGVHESGRGGAACQEGLLGTAQKSDDSASPSTEVQPIVSIGLAWSPASPLPSPARYTPNPADRSPSPIAHGSSPGQTPRLTIHTAPERCLSPPVSPACIGQISADPTMHDPARHAGRGEGAPLCEPNTRRSAGTGSGSVANASMITCPLSGHLSFLPFLPEISHAVRKCGLPFLRIRLHLTSCVIRKYVPLSDRSRMESENGQGRKYPH
jgi:hypothetical protein